ncbi:general substrate transporter [Lipomyces orientalis]|uniref:General substrate transporter n=1 Tax=Lipomyces orientalis TaxID=1233043 RepID=A0ACC3TJX6_9ASCO
MVKEYHGLRGKPLSRVMATIAGIGFFLFGYDQGVTGGLLTLDTFIDVFPEIDTVSASLSDAQRSHNSTVQGAVVALYEIGCMCGALACIYVGDKFGRRKTIFGGAIIMTIGAAIQASSLSLAQFIAGRIVTGIGNGFITATVPTWQSECAKPEMRGPLVVISTFLTCAGVAFSYWIDLGFYFVDGQANWRFPIAFQIVFALVLLSTVLQLPESPRWLIKQDRIDEAVRVFAALADIDIDSPYILENINEIRATLTIETRGSVLEVFTMGKERHFHRAMLGMAIQAMQQIAGINVVIYYSSYIYEHSIGLSPLNSKIVAAASGTEYWLACIIPYFTIERFGRRNLLVWTAAAMGVTLAGVCVAVYYADKGNTNAGIGATVLVFVYCTINALGWTNIPWLYPAEVTSLSVRASANGLSTASNWIINFMVVMITPIAINNIGAYAYLIFAACNFVINAPVVFIFFPETAGRSLEEIDHIFEMSDPKRPWDVVRVAREMPKLHVDVLERPKDQGELPTDDKPAATHVDDTMEKQG